MLLLVPWLILEPIKPIGFVLLAHKHHLAATLLIIVGEVVKLTLFEQLFDMTKPKLMSFRWFAWCYGRWRAAIEYRAVAACLAQDAQLVSHRSSLGASVADQLRIARTVQNGGYFGTVCAETLYLLVTLPSR